ncbi:MAG: HEAT repeat domain-containing protein [Planctomycetota bacterium]
MRELAFGFGELDDAVLKSIFDGMADIPSGRDRGQILKGLIGITNPMMVDPLIKIALYDPEDDAREEAVDALATFLQMPRVRQTLEQVAQHDTHRKVKRHARQALSRSN